MILAVHRSRVEPRLRHLAQTLAFFANDDGGEIWPGIDTLKRALGCEERTVRADLRSLLESGVLERHGHHGHTRRFRFSQERLTGYEPPLERTAAARRDAARRREANPVLNATRRAAAQRRLGRPSEGTTPEPCTTVQGRAPGILHNGAPNPARPCCQPCTTVLPTLHDCAPDLHDLQDLQELTGAHAPAHPDEETEDKKTREAGGAQFRVYAAIATEAINRSLRDDHSEDLGNIAEWFKVLCARQDVTYVGDIGRRAVDAALRARAKAKRLFEEKLQQVAGRRPAAAGDARPGTAFDEREPE